MNNPLAFPKDGPAGSVQSGMSMRDYFAGQALTVCKRVTFDEGSKMMAQIAYSIADAMLKEGQKPRSAMEEPSLPIKGGGDE